MVAVVVVLAIALCATVVIGFSEMGQSFNSSHLGSSQTERDFISPRMDSGQLPEELMRIIGGEAACRDQFRHHARIVSDENFQCGGSLIKPTAILTIGWCVARYKKFTIRLGTIMREGPDDSLFTVESIWGLVHPEYNSGTYYDNDVAVILLNVEVPLGRSIWPVMLPSVDEVKNSFTGRRALISGWGQLTRDARFQDRLRFAELTVISNDLCQKFYKEDYIVDSSLCAGNNFTGFCYGDHGGALVVKVGGHFMQIGIASFVVDSCNKAAPGVFARVTSFLEWIQRAAGNLDDWGADENCYCN